MRLVGSLFSNSWNCFAKTTENGFYNFWPFWNIIWHFLPRNINVHIRKVKFASTRNSGNPFPDLLSHFWFSCFRTSGRNFERSTRISKFGWNFKLSAGFWTPGEKNHFKIDDFCTSISLDLNWTVNWGSYMISNVWPLPNWFTNSG